MAGPSTEKLGLIENEEVAHHGRSALFESVAVQVVQHLKGALVVAVVDVIGLVLPVARSTEVVRGLNNRSSSISPKFDRQDQLTWQCSAAMSNDVLKLAELLM